MVRFSRSLIFAASLASTPVNASPSVFWAFGFEAPRERAVLGPMAAAEFAAGSELAPSCAALLLLNSVDPCNVTVLKQSSIQVPPQPASLAGTSPSFASRAAVFRVRRAS